MKLFIVIVLIFTLSYFAGQWLKDKKPNTTAVRYYQSDCNLKKTVCVVLDGDYKYSVKLDGEVSPLVPFIILLKTEANEPLSVTAEFLMDGMDMGYNQHILEKGEYDWRANVILPVCALGRRDWVVRLRIEYREISIVSEFMLTQ